jgi:uncharacterized membrane protein
MVEPPCCPQVDAEFSAVLTPHRSLGPLGFLILMMLVGSASFAAGTAFYRAGAWPVVSFLGLDVLLVYVAFRLNFRAARLYETIDLLGDELKILRVYPSGRSQCWSFNPYWVRLEIVERPGRRKAVTLSSHGRTIVVGSFLSDDEKSEFAEALDAALQNSRGGRRI